jgi:hypothetical protein
MLFNAPSSQTTADVRDWNGLCFAAIQKEQAAAEDYLLSSPPMQPFLQRLPMGYTSSDLRAHFVASHAEIDLSSILFMVASVEARIRFDASSRAQRHADPLGKSLARLFNIRGPGMEGAI